MKIQFYRIFCLVAVLLQLAISHAATHTLRLKARPDISCTFNTDSTSLEAGATISLSAYTQTGFKFLRWEDEAGALVSNSSYFQFTMPEQDALLYAVCEYNPENPANPAINYWNKETGEVIVDDFTPGNLSGAISSALAGSSREDVNMITVSGMINNNDLGIINNYKNCYLLDLSRVSGITEIPSYAFDYTNLESVYLPAMIEKIGARAFYDCKKLTSLTVYAMVPPTLESDVFSGVQDGLIIYVPAAAIARYQEAEVWKDFIILPIQEDIRSISVSLPEGTNVADYAQMWLELTNTKSGQRIHYVMTDRQTYTFANIIRNTTWNVCLRNERGEVFGHIENVEVKDEDVAVAFASLSKPQQVSLAVLSADGTDVTAKTQVTWLDAAGNYLAQSTALSGLLQGNTISYNVALSQELAMQYAAPLTMKYVVGGGDNHVQLQLETIKQITLSGNVKDVATKTALNGAIITASQTFGSKYSKTISTKTDSKGNYSLTISSVPTSLAVSASDYISQTIVCDSLMTGEDIVTISDVSLKGISGAVVTLGLTYTKCPSEDGNEDTFQEWYADYNNVAYSIYNKTKQKSINQFNVQYPQIVLLEEVEEGDVLEMTATSKVNAFMPVKTTATIDAEQRANAAFNIIELGKIRSAFAKNSNAAVVGSLYDVNGKLVKSYDYSNASLTINDLTDGSYTLVTMGASKLFNSIYDLSQLPQTGLVLGTDYTQTSVEVKSGKVCAIDIVEVPTLDESKLYYTGDNTSFTVNKSSIVAGNYLTLTGHLDFKSAYAGNVSNVNLIVDLPESCEFVENSVMVGNNTSSYIIQDNRITIPMARYTDRVRFCIIPTLGGEYAPSALAQFDLDGETITQPIGSANYTAKDLSISVPSTVAKTTIPVSGTAIGASAIEIYDGGVLIGQTNSLANGAWATTCELNNAYNLSTHNIYAKVTTKNGLHLISENLSCIYDMNAIQVSKVVMYHDNPEMHKTYELTFDFLNPSDKEENYIYYIYNKKFTFTIDFTNNDTTKVSNVVLYVKTAKSGWHPLDANYDSKIGMWFASGDFGNMYDGDLPVNVSVDYQCNSLVQIDRFPFDEFSDKYNNSKNEEVILKKELEDYSNEINQINEQGKIEQENIDHIISSLNEELSFDDQLDLISQLASLCGFSIDNEDYNVSIPDLSEDEMQQFVDSLIVECDSLLNTTDNSFSEYETVLQNQFIEIDSIVNDDLFIDLDESFSSLSSDTIYLDCDDIRMSFVKMDLSNFQIPEIDSTQISKLYLTDGSYLTIYCGDENTFIVDSINNSVIAINNASIYDIPSLDYNNSRARHARASSDIIENLKKAASTLEKVAARVSEIGSSLSKDLSNNIERLESFIKSTEKEAADLSQMCKAKTERLAEVKQKLSTLKNKKVYRSYLNDQIAALEAESQSLSGEIKRIENLKNNANARISKLKASKMAKVALLSEVTDYILLTNNARKLITYIWQGIADYNKWTSFINTILPCENDYQNAHNLKYMSTDARDAYLREYGKAAGLSGLSTFIAGYMTFNKAAKGLKFIFKLGIGLLNDYLDETSQAIFNNALSASKQRYANYTDAKKKLKCRKDPEPDPDGGGGGPTGGAAPLPNGGGQQSGNNDKKFGIDPSGFVYEGVFSNRLEGVIATAYYKEMVEDMYGDLYENIVKWDAEEYAQENPLFTDENGYYRWDVPQGLWQVKFEKDGYETTYSEWLPVPPPQLDVNIAMKQNVQPNVKNARAYEDAVEVEFDKYMMPELLNAENIIVMVGDKQVEGSVEMLNEEVKYEGESETFASKVRFNATTPFEGTEVTLMVNNRVKSYAGIRMQDNYSQSFTIEQEIRKIVCDSATVVGYGHSGVIPVTVLPASASAGKVLNVRSSSSMILGTDVTSIKLDENGCASIPISGELPGTAALTFTIDGYDLFATTIVNVEQIENVEIEAPKANIASGTTVEKGTAITLSCATEGATIYYTLDGSCPCDEATRLIYTEPIVINKTVTIKAMAVDPNMTESDIVEFTYLVDEEDGINEVTLDTDLKIYPLPVRDKLNVTAGGKTIKSVTLTSMSGSTVVKASKPVTMVTLDVSSLTPGIYIINVATEDKTYSRKIMKVE